jgi:DNA-binding transcriptional LysR family regulator
MTLLVRAVEAGSLSKASRELGLPLATVSRKISELEAHLNTTLLTRSAKGLAPTTAGHSFIAAAKTILDQLTEAERAAAGEYSAPKGDLVVTAPTMFGRLHVLPVIMEFLSVYPEVDVALVLTDRVAHLVDDHVDVADRRSSGQCSHRQPPRICASRGLCQSKLLRRTRAASDPS